MALYKSKFANRVKPVPSVISALIATIAYDFTTETALANGDIIDLGPIPAGLEIVDVVAIFDDHDAHASPTVTMSVGILNSGKTALNSTGFIVDSTAAQTGGVARATTTTAYLLAAGTAERSLGVIVTAAVATAAAVGKKICVLLSVRN